MVEIQQLTDPVEARQSARDPRFVRDLIRASWYAGDLAYQLRPNGQTWIYDWLTSRQGRGASASPYVVETHRRLGKTYLWALICVERCLRRPGTICRFFGPDKKQLKKILLPNLLTVLRDCPKELRPKGREQNELWVFENPRWGADAQPSELHLNGVNHDRGDSLRGEATDVAVGDEVRDILSLKYIVNEVLAYQFSGRPEPLMALISTRPRTAAHDFVQDFVPRAIAQDRYFRVRASENPDFSRRDRQIVLDICGSEDSISWRREAECEQITDASEMIVPEFSPMKDRVVREVERPEHFYPEVCLDSGLSDYTHCLFGYVDFRRARLVVEDEIWAHYVSSGQMAEYIREREYRLWPGRSQQIRRYADATLQQLWDLRHDHDLQVAPARKHDKDATLSSLRTAVGAAKIVIHPRCRQLIYQLENGIWDERRRDWVRNETLGHCDGIAALAYFNRMASWRRNPYPVEARAVGDVFYRRPPPTRHSSPLARALGAR